MTRIVDLDFLRPETVIVKLAGKEVNISFVSCSMGFDLSKIFEEIGELDQEKIKINDKEESKKASDLIMKLCATYCMDKNPEMTVDWLEHNATPLQIRTMADEIKVALAGSYAGAEEYGKN